MTGEIDAATEAGDLLIGTYNLLERGMYPRRAGEQDRYDLQVRIMRDELPCHVWTVQEIGSPEAFATLAEQLGMEYTVTPAHDYVPAPVFDPGRRGFGVGVMWNPSAWSPTAGISAVPGSLRTFTQDVFFHGVAAVLLDVGDDVLLHVAAGHATPWGAPDIITEAKRWLSIMTRPNRRLEGRLGELAFPGVLGTDSNGLTGDRVQRPDGTWAYHADDPYAGMQPVLDLVYQAPHPYQYDEAGLPVPIGDRAAGDVLYFGGLGLRDTSAVLDLPFAPTVGYHHTDPYPPRDIDHLRVTPNLRDAVVQVDVLDNEQVRAASDHRPKRTWLSRHRLRQLRMT